MTRQLSGKKYAFLKNRKKNSQYTVFLVLTCVLLAGCAHRIPLRRPLGREGENKARELLTAIQQRQKVDALDADVTVTWSGYGRKIHFSGGLQAVASGRFRLSALDPLGRPLFLLVVQESTFTFLDTRQGSGYTGPVDSDFLHRYIPASVTPAILFSLVTARLPDMGLDKVSVGRGDRKGSLWFTFPSRNNCRRLAEVDAGRGQVLRQMLVDGSENTVVDFHYDGYPAVKTSSGKEESVMLPTIVRIEGGLLPGSTVVRFDRVYPDHDVPDSLFTLAVPRYFTILQVK